MNIKAAQRFRSYIKPELRRLVLGRFNGLCGYCGKDKATVIDHIHPHAHGGPDSEENLMPACKSCNSFKYVWSLEEFRRELSFQLERARKRSINFRMLERFGQVSVVQSEIIFFFEKPLL